MFNYPDSPQKIAGHVLSSLEREYKKWFPGSSGEHPFADRVFAYIKANKLLSADDMVREISAMKGKMLPAVIEDIFSEIDWKAVSPDFKLAVPIVCAVIADSFAMQASVPNGNVAEAWRTACLAEYFLRYALAQRELPRSSSPLSALAKKAAAARHKSHREQKQRFKDWLKINRIRYSTPGWKNRAAKRASVELGLNERTLRNWLIEA